MLCHLFLENTSVPTSIPQPAHPFLDAPTPALPFPQARCAPASVQIDVTCPSRVLPYKEPRPQDTGVKASPGVPGRGAWGAFRSLPCFQRTSLSTTIQNKSKTPFHLLGPFIQPDSRNVNNEIIFQRNRFIYLS